MKRKYFYISYHIFFYARNCYDSVRRVDMIKKFSALYVLCALFVMLAVPSTSSANETYKATMANDYTWTLQFNEDVKPNVINRSYVYIGDENGEKLPGYTFSRVTVQGNKVNVAQPLEGYEDGKTYTLVVTNRFSSASGDSFGLNVNEKFTVGEQAPTTPPQPEKPTTPEKPTEPSVPGDIENDVYKATMNENATWTLQFNENVKDSVINRSYVYIGDANGKKLSGYTFSRITVDGKTVKVAKPLEGYEDGKTYTLVITNRFSNASGDSFGLNVSEQFTIGTPTTPEKPEEPEKPTTPEEPKPTPNGKYSVVNISSTGKWKVRSSYNTFAEAKRLVGNNQGVVRDGKLLAMKQGFIQTKAANGNVLTRVYADAALTKERTYLPANVEISYVDATERSIKVNVAGQEGYIAHANAIFQPFNAYFTRNYYANVNGDLAHYVYSSLKNGYDSYTISAAPKFMLRGVKYYSVDGATFTDQAGNVIGTSYPYYQVASIRSKTKFSAAQIDAYINKILATRGSSAVQKSKLKGLGTTLVTLQNKYNINALAILSMAQHESAYGMSDHALKHNNLFGLNVTDNGNPADTYPSVANNIETLVVQYLEKKYLPPTAWFANSSTFGNKDYGMNVKYASDPYWGSKIAGHYYRMMDMMKGMGYGEDMRYAVGRFTKDTVQTYKFSGLTQNAFAYNGNAKGKFVLILGETSTYYKISSDVNTFDYVFVPKHVLEKVTTH